MQQQTSQNVDRCEARDPSKQRQKYPLYRRETPLAAVRASVERLEKEGPGRSNMEVEMQKVPNTEQIKSSPGQSWRRDQTLPPTRISTAAPRSRTASLVTMERNSPVCSAGKIRRQRLSFHKVDFSEEPVESSHVSGFFNVHRIAMRVFIQLPPPHSGTLAINADKNDCLHVLQVPLVLPSIAG